MSNVVEVRFDCGPYDMSEKQVFGLLRAFPDEEISVGLGYAGQAAAVVLDVAPDDAEALSDLVADKARALGLTVTHTEVLSADEYEQRGLAEAEGF